MCRNLIDILLNKLPLCRCSYKEASTQLLLMPYHDNLTYRRHSCLYHAQERTSNTQLPTSMVSESSCSDPSHISACCNSSVHFTNSCIFQCCIHSIFKNTLVCRPCTISCLWYRINHWMVLVNLQELNLENKGGIGRDESRETSGTVCVW